MKGILKDKLDHVEMPVPEHLWANVSAQIGGNAAAATGTSAWTILKSVGMGAAIMAAVGTATWWVVQSDEPTTPVVATTTTVSDTEKTISNEGQQSPAETSSFQPSKSEAAPSVLLSLDSKNDALANATHVDTNEPKSTQPTLADTPDPLDHPAADQRPFQRPDRESSPQVPAITALFSVHGADKSQVHFEPLELSSGMTYHWDFGDGEESHELSPTHVYEQAGNYYATLTVTNSQGSSVTSGQEVTIERKGDLQVANIITPNGDGYNDVFDPAGLDEGVKIDYLLIMDIRGDKVFESSSHPQWDGRLASGEEAPNGVYIYLLRGTDKNNGIIEKSSKLTVKR